MRIDISRDMKDIIFFIKIIFWWSILLSVYYQMHYCWERYNNYTLTLFEFKDNSCREYGK